MSAEPPIIEPWNDPAIEARVVAYVLGESSAFEAAEVERLISDHPELAAFARRIRAVHGLLGEDARATVADAWKLSPERREKVMAAFGRVPVRVSVPSKSKLDFMIRKFNTRHRLRFNLTLAASVAFGIFIIGSMSSHLGTSVDMAEAPVPTISALSLPPSNAQPETVVLDTELPRELLAGTPKDVSESLAAHEPARRRLVMNSEGEGKKRPSAPSSSARIIMSSSSEANGKTAGLASPSAPGPSSGVDQIIEEQEEILRQARMKMHKAMVDYDIVDSPRFSSASGGRGEDEQGAFLGTNGKGSIVAGNRSGDIGVTKDTIDSILNTPTPPGALNGREDVAKVESKKREEASDGLVASQSSEFTTSFFSQLSVPPPAAGPVGAAVDLAAAPPIADFDGFINFGSPVEGFREGQSGKDNASKMQVVREYRYDSGLEKPESPAKPQPPTSSSARALTASGSGAVAFPVTPATPTAFETRVVDGKEMIYPTEYDPPELPDHVPSDQSAGAAEPSILGDIPIPIVGRLFANNDEKPGNVEGAEQQPKQVTVTSKFVEVQQAGQSELGFGWSIANENTKATLKAPEEDAQTVVTVEDPFAGEKTANKPAPLPAPSLEASDAAADPVSTFSLNVSDASFQMGARALLQEGKLPEAGSVRTEDYVNAMDYGDAMPGRGEAVSAVVQQAGHPFVPGRNLVRVGLRTGAVGRGQGQPLALTILLDQSGSMERPDRADAVAAAVEKLSGMLQENDVVTVVGFARTPRLLADRLSGAKAGELPGLIRQAPPQGGTNFEAALDLATASAAKQFNPKAQNRIVLITDGAANLGQVDPDMLMAQVDILRRRQIAFDACGVGMAGVDDTMLEALTRKGDGRYILMDGNNNENLATELAGAFRPAARNVKVQVRFNPDRVGKFHLYGFEKHRLEEKDFRDDTVDAAELAAAEQGNALYQIELRPDGQGDIGDVAVRFQDTATGQMVERHWTIPYDPQARSLAEASPSMQLAGLAGLMAENLKGSTVGQLVRWPDLGAVENNLRRHYPHDAKVATLLQMAGRIRSLRGTE